MKVKYSMILTINDVKTDASKITEIGNFVITYTSTEETEDIVYEVKTFERYKNTTDSFIQNNLFLTHNQNDALMKYEETINSFK